MSDGQSGGAELDTLSVVFTDLVGSTELRARLGEDSAEVVRRARAPDAEVLAPLSEALDLARAGGYGTIARRAERALQG